MTHKELIDNLCKQGYIDGNLADRITYAHEQEVKCPIKPIRDKVMSIVNEMFAQADRKTFDENFQLSTADANMYFSRFLRSFAERLDDALTSNNEK